jgi:hypothetical protein
MRTGRRRLWYAGYKPNGDKSKLKAMRVEWGAVARQGDSCEFAVHGGTRVILSHPSLTMGKKEDKNPDFFPENKEFSVSNVAATDGGWEHSSRQPRRH